MPSTKSISLNDLSELVDILQTLGIEIRSPHEQMISEERALGNSRAQPPTQASAAPAAEPSPTESTPAEPTPAPTPPAECTHVEETPAEAAPAEAAPAEAAEAPPSPAPPAPNTSNPAPASGGGLLTRAMVIQALFALGVDPVELEPRGTPITGGPAAAVSASSASSGGGGTAVATSSAVQAVPQPVAKAVGHGDLGSQSGRQWSIRPNAPHFYVVTVGREVGIFDDWHVVAPLVSRVSGAVFKRYPTLGEAEAVFDEALAQGRVRRV